MNRDERQALERAEKWVGLDPFYKGQPPTEREQALMALAIRCYTAPVATDTGIARLTMEREEAALQAALKVVDVTDPVSTQTALDNQVLYQAARISDGLHTLADEVAKVPLRESLKDPGRKDYFGFLTDVLHKMRAGNGNLVAEGLVRACGEAHGYSRGEK